MSDEEWNDVYQEGTKAAFSGEITVDMNPYNPSDWRYRAWINGYYGNEDIYDFG